MVARSAARPMSPPRASTSRTTVPFAIPPMAGLQDIWPMVSRTDVSRSVRAPRRADMVAASVPAATTDNYDVIVDRHRVKLLDEDMQRLDAPTHRGKPLTGFGTIGRLADFPKQPEQRLTRFGC